MNTENTEPISGSEGHIHFSKAAVASGVLGIIGLATLWFGVGLFLAAIGAICGHMAHYYISASGKKLRGRRVATFGLGSSYLAMIFFPLLLGIAAASGTYWKNSQTARVAQLEEKSKTNASRLFVACESYSRASKGKYPEEWENLSGKYIPSGELKTLLKSPYIDEKSDAFELLPHERPVFSGVLNSVIVIQQIASPAVRRVAVVYADGNVALILNPDRS